MVRLHSSKTVMANLLIVLLACRLLMPAHSFHQEQSDQTAKSVADILIMMVDGESRTRLKFSATEYSGKGNILGAKGYRVLEGSRSEIRAAGASLSFELSARESVNIRSLIRLVRLEVGSNYRRIRQSKVSGGRVESGPPEERVVPLDFENLGKAKDERFTKYRIKPQSSLEGGEYALVVGGSLYFDFGVDTKPQR